MNLLKDPSMLKRLNEINELPSKEKEALLLNVDAFFVTLEQDRLMQADLNL